MTYLFIFDKIEKMQYENFGKFIRAKRESLTPKVAQNKFATDSGVEPAILCRVELLQQDIKLLCLSKLAEGFGMKASELLKEFEDSDFS